jgi:hypothetical protein
MYFGTKSYLKSNHYHTPKHPLKLTQENCIKNLLDSVVAGAFQITFRVKIHVNDVFSFFKNYFWHQHIKTIQNVQTILNFSKKKKFKIFWERGLNRVPKRSLSLLASIFFYLFGTSIICSQTFQTRCLKGLTTDKRLKTNLTKFSLFGIYSCKFYQYFLRKILDP